MIIWRFILKVFERAKGQVCPSQTPWGRMGERTLAHRAYTQGYYWPTMKQDIESYVKICDRCQRHAPIPYVPSKALNLVTSPCPFMQWGMDIVSPLSTRVAQKKFLDVAND